MELSTLEMIVFWTFFAAAATVSVTKVFATLARVCRGRVAGTTDKARGLRKSFLYTFLQMSNLRSVSLKDPSGLVHGLMFWAALVMGVYFLVFLVLGDGLGFAGFLRQSDAVVWLLPVAEWAAIVLVAAMVFGAVRRLIKRPERLGPHFEGPVFSLLTAGVVLLIGGMLVSEGLRAFLQDSDRHALLVGALVHLFERTGLGEASSKDLWTVFWWVQAGTVMGLMVYAPFSGHRHPLYGPLNLFLQLARHPRTVAPVDLESADRLGASRVEDLTWKQLLETLSCAQCGRCQDACPAHRTGKPLSPKNLLREVWRCLEAEDDPSGFESITESVLSCTMCGACIEACPMTNRPMEVVLELRRGLVFEGVYEDGHRNALKRVSRDLNPLGYRWNRRTDFLQFEGAREGEHYECIYWLGCLAAFDETARRIAEATASILREAGVHFAVLGTREACCGDFVRRLGDEGLFQRLADRNMETLASYDFDRILTHCPHCYNALAHEYPKLGSSFEVVHHSRFLEEILNQGRVETRPGKERIAFHDPCYLGRFNQIYESPRKVLASIAGEVIEFPGNRERSFCCGAGGGHVWREMEAGERMGVRRLAEVSDIAPDVVATACPFCLMMLQEASAILCEETRYRVVDLAELVEGHV
jgi:Fe-S oxidoreductase